MRIAKLVVAFLALSFMAGCTNTYHGAKENIKDNLHWLHNEPSHMEKNWGPAPTGYYGQHKRATLLKPVANSGQLAWTEVPPPAITADGPVTVYPLDGAPAQQMQYQAPQYADNDYNSVTVDYGQLMQQLYFDHASAAISRADRAQLMNWGRSVKNQQGVAITVVGHASLRVDGVTDPVRRKEINFEMAQKRANAVTAALQKSGVMRGWIESISKGEEEATGNEAADRRADVFMK